MEEQFVSVLDYAKDVLGQISDFVSWSDWPKVIRIVAGIVMVIIMAILGMLLGPILMVISAIALVISFVGFLVFEDLAFSFSKPLLSFLIGFAWAFPGYFFLYVGESSR